MIIFINKLSYNINKIVEKISVVLLFVITILTSVGIFTRYFINIPIIWLSEVTMVLFAWITFLGISIAFKNNENISLEFLINGVPKRASKIIKMVIKILVIVFFIIVIKDGAQIIQNTIPQKYNTINLSTAWFYASFPVCAVISIIHLINETFEILFEK